MHSGGGKSGTSGTRSRGKGDGASRKPIFLRGVDRELASHWFDEEDKSEKNEGLKIWADWTVLSSTVLRGVGWVWVSVVRPAGLQGTPASGATPTQQDENGPSSKIIAQLQPWEDAPDTRHIALSSMLCAALDERHVVGATIRIEPAPQQVPKTAIKTIRVFPFATPPDRQRDGFKFGGKTKKDREDSAQKLFNLYGRSQGVNRLLDGPLTDGMLLPPPLEPTEESIGWEGGLIKFDPPPGLPGDGIKASRGWVLGSERRISPELSVDTGKSPSPANRIRLEVMAEMAKPTPASTNWTVGESLPLTKPKLAGMDSMITQLLGNIKHCSSVLLTGALGSGKTAIAQFLAMEVRQSELFHTTYFPCQSLANDDTRVSKVKETLHRVFALASWGARLGGKAFVILDDLDKICPAETELQVGNDNQQSRHISELVISTVKHYCSSGSRVVLLATAQSKESVNNIVIGGHVVRDIINLTAPDKETRKDMLDSILKQDDRPEKLKKDTTHLQNSQNGDSSPESSRPQSRHSSSSDSDRLGSDTRSRGSLQKPQPGFVVDSNIDLLDVAGRTDGYMPGDLQLLVSRTRSQALLRSLDTPIASLAQITINDEDFDAALKGFTPSSLRNVTLQHSNTTFSSIGGLSATRKTLLETLQYPTLYAPIFARSPLRLRSGLLLYGYPGCGKTLLASAVAGECGLNFISVKGPEILNKYIGASEKSVRDLFERAQAARPCVLFFDEFDSIAPKRGHDSTGVTDRVVNQMLTQMDGAEGLSGVYVLAATSRPDLIDPALLRPGRLDKSLLCDMPAHEDRVDILRALSKSLKFSPKILREGDASKGQNLEEVGQRTNGYSGADLQAVVYNAHLEAIHDAIGDRQGGVMKPRKQSEPNGDLSTAQMKGIPEFSYFRYGQDVENENTMSAASKTTERAMIVSDLAAHRAAQQRARAARHGSMKQQFGDKASSPADSKSGDREPIIEWKHIERSLSQTRPSISAEERRRLAGIYREFVVGRNGEMPSGQGGSEIGGRSSLM